MNAEVVRAEISSAGRGEGPMVRHAAGSTTGCYNPGAMTNGRNGPPPARPGPVYGPGNTLLGEPVIPVDEGSYAGGSYAPLPSSHPANFVDGTGPTIPAETSSQWMRA